MSARTFNRSIRWSEAERERIEVAATLARVTFSEFVRAAAAEAATATVAAAEEQTARSGEERPDG